LIIFSQKKRRSSCPGGQQHLGVSGRQMLAAMLDGQRDPQV